MHDPRFPYLPAAIASAGAMLVSAISALLLGAFGPDALSIGRVFEVGTAALAAGFLYFVKRWIARQEEADRRVMDTLRAHIDEQQKFERRVIEFMGLIVGHLGLHRPDSDPMLMIGGRRKGDPSPSPESKANEKPAEDSE